MLDGKHTVWHSERLSAFTLDGVSGDSEVGLRPRGLTRDTRWPVG
jgi:hypothetical protein